MSKMLLTCHNVTVERNTEIKTCCLVLEPCLCIKSAVFRATLPMKLGCMNVKMNLGPLLKFKVKYFLLLITKASINKNNKQKLSIRQ